MASMESVVIRHRTVAVNDISMHVAEAGPEGQSKGTVLFLHGFPELWYSWRHQMENLATRGYHCVAPDLRGYGGTTALSDVESYTAFHIVGDIVALLNTLGLAKLGRLTRQHGVPHFAPYTEDPRMQEYPVASNTAPVSQRSLIFLTAMTS